MYVYRCKYMYVYYTYIDNLQDRAFIASKNNMDTFVCVYTYVYTHVHTCISVSLFGVWTGARLEWGAKQSK